MINVNDFLKVLKSGGVNFFAGVPDSLLKNLCDGIENDNSVKNTVCANEGAAVALAAGHYLSAGNIGAVYMQNSGIGNAINPLLSLVDEEVYSIPVLLIIGWRGEPGVKDEPQHIKQGKVTGKLLDAVGIPYSIIDGTSSDYSAIVSAACDSCAKYNSPHAIIVRENTFEKVTGGKKNENNYPLERENAIKIILQNIDKDAVIVSTTGKISRELFELRELFHEPHSSDFLTVGSMGHASQIALGIAMNKKDRTVFCLDGDGAAIMHMGSLGIIGTSSCENFRHIIINNGAHDSVGGQKTIGFEIDFLSIAKGCGYKTALRSENEAELIAGIKTLNETKGPALLEVRVKTGSRKDLGRPSGTPVDNKLNFIKFINQ